MAHTSETRTNSAGTDQSATRAPNNSDYVPRTDPDFSEHRARHIFRVANQRERRRANPFKARVYRCKPCDRRFASRFQLLQHQDAGPHKRVVQRIADKKLDLCCRVCDLRFDSKHNSDEHIKGKRYRAAKRRHNLLV